MKMKLNCILLVDDDEPTNFLNKLAVEELECTEHIRIIPGAREALDYLTCAGQPAPLNQDCPAPEIIFLDINMPAMDGWEFLQKYETLPAAHKSSIIVVMLTTSFNPEDELKARNIQSVTEFRNKPLTPDLLQDILQKYFPDKY
ncbi:histidine kinase [Niastella yeongjuensis]|uniref:Histidine kinase n=1 Tax=Niastella yeongjuensis TaxID=354355 RepID=A0A1V9EFV3_9BACT|nr:response regulator [Niastella yeongjuensis]OQP45019.1 histidine kinase [Niastella yeongjuensis]SEP49048.1 CheY chemotaxis protein or a CheY-like REC (receiver) domain [Niastella yeongjuensis]